jgi:predicted Zn-dependent protease
MLSFFKNIYNNIFIIIIVKIFLYSNLAFTNFIRDTEIESILNEWSAPIFEVAGIPAENIKINLIADNNINAFVTEGKNMFINTGLIIKAGSANGLIGVIAHETGHIAGGHIIKLKQAIRKLQDNQFFTSLLGVGVLVLSSKNDNFKDNRTDMAKTILSIAPSLAERTFYSYSRGNEYIADNLAIEYLLKVNRNPASLSIILEKLYGQELLLLERQDPFLRTHPLSKERMAIIKQKAPDNNIPESNKDKVSYLRMKAKLEGFLEDPGKVLLRNKGNSIQERYARTIAYFRAPMYKNAIQEIDLLLRDYPKDPYFMELKAQIYSENGHKEKAIKMYKESLQIIPNSPLIMLSLSGLLLEGKKNKKKFTEARYYVEKVIRMEPENILAWHLKGIIHNYSGEFMEADLSAAEEFLRRRDFKMASYFANKVIMNSKRFSSQNLRASDIIKLINQKKSKG